LRVIITRVLPDECGIPSWSPLEKELDSLPPTQRGSLNANEACRFVELAVQGPLSLRVAEVAVGALGSAVKLSMRRFREFSTGIATRHARGFEPEGKKS